MAAGAENKIVLLDILFDSGASQMAKTFAFSLACVFRVGVLIENADAKAEDATLREKMSRVKRRDFSRSGVLRGIRPRIKFNFLWEEFCLQNSSGAGNSTFP